MAMRWQVWDGDIPARAGKASGTVLIDSERMADDVGEMRTACLP